MIRTESSGRPRGPFLVATSSRAPSPWLAMIPLMIPIIMANVDITAVNLALAHIARDLDVSLSVIQWVVNGYMMTVVTAYLFLPETPARPATRFDLGGQTLLALGLFALITGLNAVANQQGRPLSMVGFSGAGLLFFILLIFHEKRASEPMMDPELITNRTFVWASAARLAMQFSYMGFLFLICLFMQNIVFFSPVRSGMLLLWITLTMAALSPLSGVLRDKIGVRIPMVTAFFMAAAAYAGISTIGISARMEILIPCFLAIGVAYSVLMPGCNEAALGAVPKEKTGVASGMLYTLVFAGSSIAIAATGLVLHLRASHALSMYLAYQSIGLTGRQLDLLTRAATGLEHGFADPSFNFCKSLPILETIAQQSFLTGFATCMYGFALICTAGACVAWLISEPQKKVHPANNGTGS